MFVLHRMGLPILTALCVLSVHAYSADARPSFGRLDLASQMLSPKPFGPSSAFFPVALGEEVAKPVIADPSVNVRAAIPPVAGQDDIRPRRSAAAKRPIAIRAAVRKPKTNPLDSYARDNRKQAWPCKGDGICAWR